MKTIQDIMRKDAGTYGDAQRLEQLGWMFFLKIFDDREKEIEVLRDDYKSPIPKQPALVHLGRRRRRHHGRDAPRLRRQHLLPKLKALTGGADPKIAGLIRTTFEDANNYMKNGTLMRQVINKINGIDFNASDDRHMFGDIYEKILRDLQSAGNAGEFYTPRAVTQFIVEQVNPRLGETDPRPRLRHRRLPDLRPSSTCASRPRPRPTSAHPGMLPRASRRSTCRTSSA